MKTLLSFFCCLAMACSMLAAPGAVRGDSGGSLPESGTDAWQIVVNDIAGQMVALLPENSGLRTLGISAIQGDDNTIAEALTAALRSATNFQIVERDDLARLLKEQGIQLSPIIDPGSAVEPGKIHGVEGLLIGRVIKKVQSPFYSSLQVFLKLDNVENGKVVFARNFEASYIPAMTWYIGFGLLAMVLLLLLRSRSGRKRKELFRGYSEKEAAARQAIEAELKKSRDNLGRAHELLLNAEQQETGILVRRSREEVDKLLQKLQQGPVVHPDSVDKAFIKEVDNNNKTMKKLVEKVRATSEKVLDAAGKKSGVESILQTMASQIKDAANAAYDRQAGRS